MSGLLLQMPDLSNADVVCQLGEVPAEMVRWVREQMDLIFGPLSAATSAAEFRLLRERSVRKFVLLSATAYNIISGELIKALAVSGLPGKALDELERRFAAIALCSEMKAIARRRFFACESSGGPTLSLLKLSGIGRRLGAKAS